MSVCELPLQACGSGVLCVVFGIVYIHECNETIRFHPKKNVIHNPSAKGIPIFIIINIIIVCLNGK